mmetsp:Transcript_33173/g.76524  ORF Transcript_33173/g.76524 Transcript_33173/m.76524 type:complete len:419 (+) Transcript_33173:1469-2725(+)
MYGVRRNDAIRRAYRRGKGSRCQGPLRRQETQQDAPRHLLPLRRHSGTHDHPPVVRQLQLHGQTRRGRRPRRRPQDPPRGTREDLVPVARQYSRLVRQPPAVVGTPDPGLVRHPKGREGRQQERHGVFLPLDRGQGRGRRQGQGRRPPQVSGRRGGSVPGRGRVGHLVLLRPLSLFRLRMAQPDRRHEGVLSHHPPRDRVGHSVLLGRAHGHDGPSAHRRPPLQDRLPPRHGAGQGRPQNVQISRERHRPSGGHQRVHPRHPQLQAGQRQPPRQRGRPGQSRPSLRLPRRHTGMRLRCPPLRTPGLHRPRTRCQPRHQARGGLPTVLQQTLERHPVRPAVRHRLRTHGVPPPRPHVPGKSRRPRQIHDLPAHERLRRRRGPLHQLQVRRRPDGQLPALDGQHLRRLPGTHQTRRLRQD